MAHDVIKKVSIFYQRTCQPDLNFFLCVNDSSMEVNNLGTPIGIASGFCF